MAKESKGGFGSCLITILLILVFLAAFGIVKWSTVGSFARFIVYLTIAGIIIVIVMMIWVGNRKK